MAYSVSDTWRRSPWHRDDEERWIKDHAVYCPSQAHGESMVRYVDDPPPECCPYKLELLMESERS
jgi:hypothetical protein